MESWKKNLYITWLAQMLVMIGFSSALPFIPLYIQELGVPNKEEAALWTGVMVSLSFVVMAVISPVWGALSDRYGRKSMLVRSMLAGGIIVFLLSFTTQVWQVFGLRILQGAFAGSVTAAVALVATITPRERMGYSLGLMQTAVFAGQSVGPLIGGFLGEHLGYRPAFLITSGFMFLAVGLVFFMIKENFTPQIAERKVGESRTKALIHNFGQFMGHKEFMTMTVILALVQFSSIILLPVLPVFVQSLPGGVLKNAGMGVSSITGLIFGLAGFTAAISAVVAGRLSDRLGHRSILMFSTLGVGIVCIPQIFVTDTFQLLLLRGLTGLFIGGIVPSANAIIGQATPKDRRGAAYGVTQSITSIGMAAGPITGAILAATIDVRVVFVVTTVSMLFISFWVSRALSRPEPKAVTVTVTQPKGLSQ